MQIELGTPARLRRTTVLGFGCRREDGKFEIFGVVWIGERGLVLSSAVEPDYIRRTCISRVAQRFFFSSTPG
jgi:hypothetical protein